MNINFKNKTVIVTAGASGIGLAITREFLHQGARVLICDSDPGAVETIKKEMPAIEGFVVDVSSEEQVEQVFSQIKDKSDTIDVLVNCAGIAGPTGPTETLDSGDWQKTLDVNLNGSFFCAKAILPQMKDQGCGSIINISSTAGLMGYPYRSPYAAAKWAVIGFTKSLAMEVGECGIRVNAIAPGSVEGERMQHVITAEAKQRGISEADIRKMYTRHTSLKTFVDAADIANMAVFLASEAGNKITGQCISVDGDSQSLAD